MRNPWGRVRSEDGQMVVELCVVMPVVLMVAVAIIDSLVFAAASSKFEHLSSQAVVAVAASPSGTDFDAASCAEEVRARLQSEMEGSKVEVKVEALSSDRVCEFDCEMSMTPWPLGKGDVMGMAIPAKLRYVSKLCVRPYEIGAL